MRGTNSTGSVLFSVVAAGVLAVAAPRAALADDGPFAVPTTAAGFGNLGGFEGGNAGGDRGQANWLDTSGPEYGHMIDTLRLRDDGCGPAYVSPARPTIFATPVDTMASTTGRSSYAPRPLAVNVYANACPLPMCCRPCR